MKVFVIILRKYKNEQKKYNLVLTLILISYSANGSQITQDISDNITQNSYIPAGITVSILNDVTIEPNVRLTIRGTGKLIIPEGKTLTISRSATLKLIPLESYKTPDIFEYSVSDYSDLITEKDGTHTDGVFTYTKEEDKFVRRCQIRWDYDFLYDREYIWPPTQKVRTNRTNNKITAEGILYGEETVKLEGNYKIGMFGSREPFYFADYNMEDYVDGNYTVVDE